MVDTRSSDREEWVVSTTVMVVSGEPSISQQDDTDDGNEYGTGDRSQDSWVGRWTG